MKWFRFYSEVLEDSKVQNLPLQLRWYWVELLCLANRGSPRGVLPSEEQIAYNLRIRPQSWPGVREQLVLRCLLEETELGLQPHNWGARQPESDNAAERMRRTRSEHVPNKFVLDTDKTRTEEKRQEEEPPTPIPFPSPVDEEWDAVLFKAYEDAIGSLSATTAELVSEASREYGDECVLHSLEAMTANGKRSWKYAEAIMRRHSKEGCEIAQVS